MLLVKADNKGRYVVFSGNEGWGVFPARSNAWLVGFEYFLLPLIKMPVNTTILWEVNRNPLFIGWLSNFSEIVRYLCLYVMYKNRMNLWEVYRLLKKLGESINFSGIGAYFIREKEYAMICESSSAYYETQIQFYIIDETQMGQKYVLRTRKSALL